MRLVIALTPLAAVLLLPGLLIGPSLDAAVFVHVAGRMLDGAAPYADAWDHKPPGIYLLLAGFSWPVPFLSIWTVSWLLSLAATVGTGLLISLILRRLGVSRGAAALAAVSAVVATAQYLMALGGGLTEPIASLAAAGGLAVALRPQPALRAMALIGVLLGASVVISLQLAPAVPPIALLALARAGPQRRVAATGALLATGLAPVALVVAWLWVIGALPPAADAIVGYSTAYRASNQAFGAVLSAPIVAWTLLAFLFLIVAAALGALAGRRCGAPTGLVVALLGWIALTVAVLVVQGRFFAHYAIPLAVPLGVLAGYGFDRSHDQLARRRGLGSRPMLLAPLAAALAVSLVAAVVAGTMELLPVGRNYYRVQRAAEVVRELAPTGTSILVWGNHPSLYESADRAPATAYGYLYPLVTPGYTTPQRIADALSDLEARPPAAVIDAGSDRPGTRGFQELLIPRELTSDGRNLDLLDPLRDFVRDRYELVETIDGWPIYRLRDSAAAPAALSPAAAPTIAKVTS